MQWQRYVGITNNLDRRLIEHRRGKTSAGRLLGAFELIFQKEFADYETARKQEKFLKSGRGRELLDQQ